MLPWRTTDGSHAPEPHKQLTGRTIATQDRCPTTLESAIRLSTMSRQRWQDTLSGPRHPAAADFPNNLRSRSRRASQNADARAGLTIAFLAPDSSGMRFRMHFQQRSSRLADYQSHFFNTQRHNDSVATRRYLPRLTVQSCHGWCAILAARVLSILIRLVFWFQGQQAGKLVMEQSRTSCVRLYECMFVRHTLLFNRRAAL